MKRGGHVAGRRCSRYLCDSVQIHPTLKRRMSKKKRGNGGESFGRTKAFPQQLRIHPQSDRNHGMRG